MSRIALGLLLAAVLVGTSAVALASVPDPSHSTVVWAGPFNGSCTFPVICPKGDVAATVNVTVHDQFGAPMSGIGANEIDAEGTCVLGGGSPCSQQVNILSNAATNGSGFTTVTVSKAGGCCTDLRIVARGVILNTLTYRSYDYTGDLKADVSDLGFMADTFNKHAGDAGYNQCFDFNCTTDGTGKLVVDVSDLGFLADHFNHVCQ